MADETTRSTAPKGAAAVLNELHIDTVGKRGQGTGADMLSGGMTTTEQIKHAVSNQKNAADKAGGYRE